jgi:tRNA A58 N-methylase Trm61
MRDNIQQNGVKQHAQKDLTPKVWGTENEENKAKVARENLMNAFSANGEWKDILERNHFEFLLGDIIENISKQHFLPSSIDALLLDSR